MTRDTTRYSDIQNALDRLDTTLFPSEVHGTLCGLLCFNNVDGAHDWLATLSKEVDESDLLQREAIQQINTLCQNTLQEINDPEFGFQLLLPDDDIDLETRLQSLGDWCQGFLAGLSIGGVQDLKSLPQDAIEIATDMAEIARAGTSYEFSDSDEDESAYQELVEYIRVGVLLINEEVQSSQTESNSPPTMH